MKMRRIGAVVAIAVCASGLAGCGSSGGDADAAQVGPAATERVRAFLEDPPAGFTVGDAAPPETVTFVGAVDGIDAYIGIVTRGDEVEVYVCDGTTAQASIATWMKGSFSGADLEVASPVAAIEATRGGDQIDGTVTVDGVSHAFTAAPDAFPADVWESKSVTPDGWARTGWIVFADGTQRGATKVGADISTTAVLDPLSTEAPLPDASIALPADVVPFAGPKRTTKIKPPTTAQRCATLLENFNFFLDQMGKDGATDTEILEAMNAAELALDNGRALGCSWAQNITS